MDCKGKLDRAADVIERLLFLHYRQAGESRSAWFDRVAERFRRDTGHIAPGKDKPQAIAMDHVACCDEAWLKWRRDISFTAQRVLEECGREFMDVEMLA